MARVARLRSTSRKRTVAYAVGAAVLVLLLVAGVAFANSISVTKVANHARALHWTNATIGTSALTRAGLVQALTFAELQQSALVDPEDVAFAMEQVHSSTEELEQLSESGVGHDSYAVLARFMVPVRRVVEQLEGGEVEAARTTILQDLETAYIELIDGLHAEQLAIQASIDDNTSSGRAFNNWVVFVLTLAVPGSAVAVYYVVARRQVRTLRERNRLELEAEREIGRAKDAFIAGLSHELRTPLTSIYGFAEILTDGGVQGKEATEETAKIIATEAAEMTRMVDDLLAASRLGSTGIEIELARTRIDDVVEAAVTPFERAGMSIERQPSRAVATVDAARLRQVLVNLLSNAVRHGGPVMGVEISEGDGVVDIEVWDNGAGVPDELIGRLFDRFVHDGTTPLLTGSVGLGLGVASRLTELMGGKLQYQRFGDKTYFIVTVPADSAEDESSDESVSVASMIRTLSS